MHCAYGLSFPERLRVLVFYRKLSPLLRFVVWRGSSGHAALSPSAAALRHHFIYQSAFLKLCYSVIDSNLETSYGKVAGEDVAVAVSSNIASDWEGLLSEGRLRALKSLSRRACCVHP